MSEVLYSDADSVKRLLPNNELGTGYDDLLTDLIKKASRRVDAYLKRKPGAFKVSADTTRYFDGNGKSELWFRGQNAELAAVPTTVAVAEGGVVDSPAGSGGTYTAWAVTDFFLWPDNALEDGLPFLKIVCNVQTGTKSFFSPYPRAVKITGRWGYSTAVPYEIQEAVEITCIRSWKRAQQAYADAGATSEFVRLQYVKELDPDVRTLLESARFAVSWI